MNNLSSLKQVLARLEPDREFWYVPGEGSACGRDVAALLQRHGQLLQHLTGKRVAVHAATQRDLAPLLVLVDGTAEQMTLLPAGLPAAQRVSIIERSDSVILLTTDPDAAGPSGIDVVQIERRDLWQRVNHPAAEAGCETGTESAAARTTWVLATSGTTGEPKLVAHTLASLTRSAKHDVARGREYRWGSLYNLTGFAGLQVFLQSWCGGSCLILARDELSSLEQRVEDLTAGGCNALSATPTMWRKLLMATAVQQLPLTQITLGGEIVDQKILDALHATFPDAKIVHIYASTEAGVGFAVRDGRAGFPAAYLEHLPSGVRMTVDPHGCLLMRSDCDEQEYLSEPSPLKRADGFVDTGDLVTRRGDRCYFLGRASGTINVGGNKVQPEEVESVLLDCEGVQLARVTSRPSPFTGSLVQAEIVPETAVEQDPDELRTKVLTHCRSRLAPYKVPAIVKVVERLEATSSGKLKRT